MQSSNTNQIFFFKEDLKESVNFRKKELSFNQVTTNPNTDDSQQNQIFVKTCGFNPNEPTDSTLPLSNQIIQKPQNQEDRKNEITRKEQDNLISTENPVLDSKVSSEKFRNKFPGLSNNQKKSTDDISTKHETVADTNETGLLLEEEEESTEMSSDTHNTPEDQSSAGFFDDLRKLSPNQKQKLLNDRPFFRDIANKPYENNGNIRKTCSVLYCSITHNLKLLREPKTMTRPISQILNQFVQDRGCQIFRKEFEDYLKSICNHDKSWQKDSSEPICNHEKCSQAIKEIFEPDQTRQTEFKEYLDNVSAEFAIKDKSLKAIAAALYSNPSYGIFVGWIAVKVFSQDNNLAIEWINNSQMENPNKKAARENQDKIRSQVLKVRECLELCLENFSEIDRHLFSELIQDKLHLSTSLESFLQQKIETLEDIKQNISNIKLEKLANELRYLDSVGKSINMTTIKDTINYMNKEILSNEKVLPSQFKRWAYKQKTEFISQFPALYVLDEFDEIKKNVDKHNQDIIKGRKTLPLIKYDVYKQLNGKDIFKKFFGLIVKEVFEICSQTKKLTKRQSLIKPVILKFLDQKNDQRMISYMESILTNLNDRRTLFQKALPSNFECGKNLLEIATCILSEDNLFKLFTGSTAIFANARTEFKNRVSEMQAFLEEKQSEINAEKIVISKDVRKKKK